MSRRLISLAILIVVAMSPLTQAHAEDGDAAALASSHEAMAEDYSAGRFDATEAKLIAALSGCERGRCSAAVIATLHRDLGVLYIAGMQRSLDGMVEFVQALSIDPDVTLDTDLATAEVTRAFEEARAAAATAAPPPAQRSDARVAPSALVHAPPAEQALNTAVPLFVFVHAGAPIDRMRVRYQAFGETDWKGVELPKLDGGFGGYIPCTDIGTIGGLLYYVQAYDGAGELEDTSGTRQRPHRVDIVHRLSGPPPHLPGEEPPAPCREANDCPPGLPGCAGAPDPVDAEKPRRVPPAVRTNWVGLYLQQDFMLIGSADGVCAQPSDYRCFISGDRPFTGTPPAGEPAGQVAGGVVPATTRLMVGYDRLLAGRFTLGARLGYALGGGPAFDDEGSFLPVHLEGRAAAFFGARAFTRPGFRPFVEVSGGAGQIDSSVTVITFSDQAAFDRGDVTEATAVRRSGVAFASAGVGTLYALGNSHAVSMSLGFCQNFSMAASSLSLRFGYAYGL